MLSEDEGKVVYDYFTVRYHHKCADLTVSVGDDLADYVYLVKTGASSVAFTPNFSLANDDSCALTTTYENREYGTATWWTPGDDISTNSAPYDFDTFLTESSTYTLDVQYTTAATFNPAVVFEIRITYAITDSTHAINASASETFLLTMKDACIDNKITCDMAAIDFTHTIQIDPSTTVDSSVDASACTQAVDGVDSSGYCSFTSSLEIWDDSTNDWLTYTTAQTATWPWI